MAAPGVADSICLVCGPVPMIENMRRLLAALQVPEAQIRHEVFNAAIAAASGRAPESPAVSPAARRQASAGAGAEQAFTMACTTSGRSVPVQAGQTLLDAAEESAVPLLSLCRAGVCGTCRVRVMEGDVRCASDLLDDADRDRGFVLACVTTAASDCAVQI
jgi:ferredoxin